MPRPRTSSTARPPSRGHSSGSSRPPTPTWQPWLAWTTPWVSGRPARRRRRNRRVRVSDIIDWYRLRSFLRRLGTIAMAALRSLVPIGRRLVQSAQAWVLFVLSVIAALVIYYVLSDRHTPFTTDAYARAVYEQEKEIYKQKATTDRKYLDAVQKYNAAQAARQRGLAQTNKVEQALAARIGEEHALVAEVRAQLAEARLNLEWTRIYA